MVWDDSVAPEATIDLDAQHIPGRVVIASMLSAAGAFLALYAYCVYSEPEKANPVAPRATVIPFNGLRYECGIDAAKGADEEHDEDEE